MTPATEPGDARIVVEVQHRMFAATLAMCIPIAVLAYFVSRSPARTNRSHWLATIRAALVLALDRVDGRDRLSQRRPTETAHRCL